MKKPARKRKEPYYISHRIKDIIHIHAPLFEQSFWVFLNCKNALEFKNAAERVLPEGATVEVTPFQSGKFTVIDFGPQGTIGLMWGKDEIHLTHECLHAVIWSLEDRGIVVSKEQDELMAYYQSFFLREIKRWRNFK